jgi:hypothetical protein
MLQTFWNWLVGDAGAGWIIGLTGLLWGIYTHYNRPKANKVVVQEVSSSRLLDIHPLHKQRLSILYTDPSGDQETIHGLNQKKIVIYYKGHLTLSDPKLTLKLKDPTTGSDFGKFSRLVIGDSDHNIKLQATLNQSGKYASEYQIEIDFLNPLATYKNDYIQVYLLSDGEVDFDVLQKNGRDLLIKIFILKNLSNLNRWRRRIYAGLLVALILTLIYLIVRAIAFVVSLPADTSVISLLSNSNLWIIAIPAVVVAILVFALQRAAQMAYDIFVTRYFDIQPSSRFEDKVTTPPPLNFP